MWLTQKIFLINYRESADIDFKNLGHDRTSNENSTANS